MNFRILIVFIFFSIPNYGQENLCRKDILNENQVFENNQIEKYSKLDFSNLLENPVKLTTTFQSKLTTISGAN